MESKYLQTDLVTIYKRNRNGTLT